jgi:uncharacterized coiled-coil protein SlyX
MSLTSVAVATSQTTDSGFGAAVANAQEAKPGVATSDVTYLGIFNKDNTKLSSPYSSSNYVSKQGNKGTLLDVKDGSEMRADFSLANANPGDNLRIAPKTSFTLPNGKPTTTFHIGVRISSTSEWRDIEFEGKTIGQFRYVKSGPLEVTFNDAVADVKSGKVTVAAPVMVWDWYGSAAENGKDGSWDGKGFSTPVTATTVALAQATPKGGETSTNKIGTIGTSNFMVVTSGSTKNDSRFYDSGSLIVDTENFTVRRRVIRLELPAGANGTYEVTPDVDNPKGADWYFADNLTFTPEVMVYGKDGTAEAYEYDLLSYEDAQKKFPGFKVDTEKTGRGVKVTTAGVPENVKVRVLVRGGEGESGNSYATYVENAGMLSKGSFKGTINGKAVEQNVINVVDIMVPIPGLPTVSGLENVTRTGELSGAIASQPKGVGVTGEPAPVGGTKQTFQFFVKNTGDAPMAAPIVTLPNGKKVAVKNVAIKPGTTGSFSVDYDVPAGSGALNFDVSLSRATLSPSSTVTFRYIDKSQDTKDKLIKDLEKERKRVDDLTKRAEQAEKDLKDAKDRISELEKDNKNQQKQIDEAAKKIVDLNKKVSDLNKELDAAEKRIAELEKQNKEQDKKIADLKTDLDKTKKRVTDLEKELAKTQKDLKDALKRLGVLEERLNTGIGKCVGTVGGSLMALIPAVMLLSQMTGTLKIPGVDKAFADMQRQMNMFNPEMARFVDQNRGAIAAGLTGLGLTALVLLPNTCGDSSIGGAVMDPLSSKMKEGSSKSEGGSSIESSSSDKVTDADGEADAPAEVEAPVEAEAPAEAEAPVEAEVAAQ